MAIKINTEKRIFTLETKHTMYQMQADTYGSCGISGTVQRLAVTCPICRTIRT